MAFVPVFILILGFTIVVDYFAGIFIEQSDGKKRKLFLIASLIANIGVLVVFKYYNFMNENFTFLLKGFALENPLPFLKILLPIGLSFHTFQAMSYTIEVYRGNHKAERHFGIYALYVMFYPQLVAGPIERPQNILGQFYEKHDFDYDRVVNGLRLMLWGFFKKIVIADRLAVFVNEVYNQPNEYNGGAIWLSTFFFAIQIYCDFSGYTDIAKGAARVMGYELLLNFNRPYFATSIKEFWSRWHISLSTWFRDYLYIPLGGNRVGVFRGYYNLFIVFLISGIWHGANWTYIVWGALHGFYIVFESGLYKAFPSLINFSKKSFSHKLLMLVITFVLVDFAWLFFRANSIRDAFQLIKNGVNLSGGLTSFNINAYSGFINSWELFFCFLFIAVLFLIEWVHRNSFEMYIKKLSITKRWAYSIGMTLVILFFGIYGNDTQFIYFQF
jgi:D-alanyl-lipoteichoic acid acyltransferase DltB (MBOAT superfamily)